MSIVYTQNVTPSQRIYLYLWKIIILFTIFENY